MSHSFQLSQRDATLLRGQIVLLQKLRYDFLNNSSAETVHDLRVASDRFMEMLHYAGKALPSKWSTRLAKLLKVIVRRLSRTHELEANIQVLNDFHARGKADTLAVEVMLNRHNQEFIKSRRKARRCISSKRFRQFEKFVSNLKASRTLAPRHSDFLEIRINEFLKFSWNILPDDKRLHELEVRTKTLLYALEIQEKISRRKYGRLLTRIRNLHELLGKIHDLFVFHKAVRLLRRDWDNPDLKVITSSLTRLSENILLERSPLYGRVYPLFAKAVPPLTSAFQPAPAMPVRSSTSIRVEGFRNARKSRSG